MRRALAIEQAAQAPGALFDEIRQADRALQRHLDEVGPDVLAQAARGAIGEASSAPLRSRRFRSGTVAAWQPLQSSAISRSVRDGVDLEHRAGGARERAAEGRAAEELHADLDDLTGVEATSVTAPRSSVTGTQAPEASASAFTKLPANTKVGPVLAWSWNPPTIGNEPDASRTRACSVRPDRSTGGKTLMLGSTYWSKSVYVTPTAIAPGLGSPSAAVKPNVGGVSTRGNRHREVRGGGGREVVQHPPLRILVEGERKPRRRRRVDERDVVDAEVGVAGDAGRRVHLPLDSDQRRRIDDVRAAREGEVEERHHGRARDR